VQLSIDLGIDVIQGWYFDKAMPAEEIIDKYITKDFKYDLSEFKK
jgi:EAL domain-containing protein (putative c-di-GMP-specific phosphodiesterase class I)